MYSLKLILIESIVPVDSNVLAPLVESLQIYCAPIVESSCRTL